MKLKWYSRSVTIDHKKLKMNAYTRNLNQILVLLNIYHVLKIIQESIVHIRRWWIRPHLSPENRDNFGAFSTIYTYFKLNDHEKFYEYLGMEPAKFDYLFQVIGSKLEKTSHRTPLSSELRLVVTLHYLRHGGSVKTVALAHRIGISTLYLIIAEVCEIICKMFQSTYMKLPTSEEWKTIETQFLSKWNFPNCVGAIDGKHIRVQTPPNSGACFYNYKKYPSIVLMAAYDAHLRFTWANVGDYGSQNDSGIFNASDFGKALSTGAIKLPESKALPNTTITCPYFFIGDGGFALKSYFLTPYSRSNRYTISQRIFNYRLSRARRTIESAFGVLVKKWNVLGGALKWKVETSDLIVMACLCLHNYLITSQMQGDAIFPYINEEDSISMNDQHEEDCDDVNIIEDDANGVQTRELLTNYFMDPVGSIPWQWKNI